MAEGKKLDGSNPEIVEAWRTYSAVKDGTAAARKAYLKAWNEKVRAERRAFEDAHPITPQPA